MCLYVKERLECFPINVGGQHFHVYFVIHPSNTSLIFFMVRWHNLSLFYFWSNMFLYISIFILKVLYMHMNWIEINNDDKANILEILFALFLSFLTFKNTIVNLILYKTKFQHSIIVCMFCFLTFAYSAYDQL